MKPNLAYGSLILRHVMKHAHKGPSNPLQELYWYGGEQWTLGAIIVDLQRTAPNQACVDRYLQGLQKVPGDR